jgi:hypothetical protein
VTVPARNSGPSHGPVALVQYASAIPADRASLARALQRELQRVGCYDGDVNGVWTTSTRMAMKTFTDRVNARLPIDAPDDVLLSLVQGHKERACGTPCVEGQLATPSGRCTPSALAARTEPADSPARERLNGAITALAPTAAVAPLALPSPETDAEARSSVTLAAPTVAAAPLLSSERGRASASPSMPQAPLAAETREEAAVGTGAQPTDPIPAQGVYEGRRRRHVRRVRPPKFLRAFVRSVQRGLAPFGIH